ncbi:MAG: NAD(P)/FAD-dependent oxidoreductase [Acidobacteria bacterium]|nr:NAD(P)/FAD-dependent oxidoreductase [Acidobacteriota bacterium]MCA1640813.1 NAD(P)/FAD-dependent oxidoreductase [Acidobacteriota bacterium]
MHDVLIIGAGPAGLSAALWCDELGLDALVLEGRAEVGGQLLWVHNPVENYLGSRAADGRELRDRFAAQVADAEFDLWTGVEIESVDLSAKRVALRSGEELQSIFMIVATGLRRRRLGVPGEAEFAGRGMIESAARDRELFAGRDVVVVGGGDSAVENALLLAEVCPTVTLVHRGRKLSARAQFAERLQGTHCVTVFTESELVRVIGGERVEAVEIRRRGALKPFQMAVGGVLVRVGYEPNTELFRDQVELDGGGYLRVTNEYETTVDNVFAAGDVASRLAPTISGAVGAGATAAKIIAARLRDATGG